MAKTMQFFQAYRVLLSFSVIFIVCKYVDKHFGQRLIQIQRVSFNIKGRIVIQRVFLAFFQPQILLQRVVPELLRRSREQTRLYFTHYSKNPLQAPWVASVEGDTYKNFSIKNQNWWIKLGSSARLLKSVMCKTAQNVAKSNITKTKPSW